MLQIGENQAQALKASPRAAALDELRQDFAAAWPELCDGVAPADLRAVVERTVAAAEGDCGLASKADIYTFVFFALAQFPGFENSAEFRAFVKTAAGDSRMAAFVGEVEPLFWRRHQRRGANRGALGA